MKARRLANGWYEYRGFEIDRIDDENGNFSHWNVTRIGELIAFDSVNTKREAIQLISSIVSEESY